VHIKYQIYFKLYYENYIKGDKKIEGKPLVPLIFGPAPSRYAEKGMIFIYLS